MKTPSFSFWIRLYPYCSREEGGEGGDDHQLRKFWGATFFLVRWGAWVREGVRRRQMGKSCVTERKEIDAFYFSERKREC